MPQPVPDRQEADSPPEYSPRLGRISPRQFQSALDRFDRGRFLRATPITAGLFGQNVFVTSTAGEFVLRGDPHYPWQFPAERFFARLIHEQSRAPVPWPYLLDEQGDIFGWPYVLMPRMPGLSLSNERGVASLTPQTRRAIARALGEMLALLQGVTWPEAGSYDLATNTVVPAPGTHRERITAAIDRRLVRAQAHADRTIPADVSWARRLVADAAGALDEPFTPCFVLGDYKEQNTTVERRGGSWQVSGVFDLMDGHFTDGEMDLCRQIGLYLERSPALATEFVAAYRARKPPRPGFAARLPVYLLHERLIVWEYYQRPSHRPYWPPHLTLREWAEPFTAAARQLADA